jgi:hypothetical protein
MVICDFKKNSACDCGSLDQIDPPTQQVLQSVKKSKVTIRSSNPSQFFESNKEIQIAGCGAKIASCGRAKEFKPNDTELSTEQFDRGAMFSNQVEHLTKLYQIGAFGAESGFNSRRVRTVRP